MHLQVDTIGHSTNFIFNIWLPSRFFAPNVGKIKAEQILIREPGEHWVARGVAALCQIDTVDCDKK